LFAGMSAQTARHFSVAGFYDLPGAGRQVSNFNVGWRFLRADASGAETLGFKDAAWEVVSLPHTVQLMPVEASGCRNYQGIAWYRKHFKLDATTAGKRNIVYFEAAMGKTQVFLNGKMVLEQIGGFLPFSIDLSELGVKPDEECLIALKVDNSDDKNYPPGKEQDKLDWTYHGGIYRDAWLITTDKVHLSDPNAANRMAAGGVFTHVSNLSEQSADVFVQTDVQNNHDQSVQVEIKNILRDPSGKVVKEIRTKVSIPAKKNVVVKQQITVKNPVLWSPETPFLYTVESRLSGPGKKPFDGGITRVGLRTVELKGTEGLFLNGKPYGKLIGGNRHQDFAYVGNALPNSQQWRDAKILRDAGCKIIRTAHYPQDPSFMDACDELGMFIIVAIPGWQYFNKDPQWSELCYQDLRNIIRRDRNHACIFAWEPILNETQYPAEFSAKTLAITKEEFPFSDTYSAADGRSKGIKGVYDLMYGFPAEIKNYNQPVFCREWGEYVDDWYAHNAPNRASRSWGEGPLLVQANHLARIYEEMTAAPKQFIGGTLWHPFDHQRGYHPDTYWGGLLDAFRQPKYAYEMFRAQTDAREKLPFAQSGPMLFVAHEMTPFSPADVTVFTNCDSVRMIRYEKDTFLQQVIRVNPGLPSPAVVFRNVFDFYALRTLTYNKKTWQKASMVFEGILDGKVVCTVKKMPSRRSTKLRLTLDHQGQALRADGSDFAVVVCEVTDDEGNVRRLAKDNVLFSVEGEGEIIGDALNGANPRAVEFGSAPVLIRSTLTPGKITVKAHVLFEGEHAPASTEMTFESIAADYPLVYSEKPTPGLKKGLDSFKSFIPSMTEEQKKKALEEVERQQTQFGEKF
jgi:beta-galactosidase